MWLLLFISFGMTSCLLIVLAVFDVLDPDREADVEEETTVVVVPPPQQGVVKGDTAVRVQPGPSSDPVPMKLQL